MAWTFFRFSAHWYICMKWSTYWLYKLFLWFFRKWVPPSALRREEPSSRRTPPQSSSRSSQKYENHVNHDLQRSTPPTNGNGHRVQHEYVDAHSDNIFRKVSTMYILINFNILSYCVENFENFKIVAIITSCFHSGWFIKCQINSIEIGYFSILYAIQLQ